MTNENELPEEFEEGMCGVIFGFEKMDQAEAFAAAVKERFNLEGRVFDGAVGAARYHMSPWQVDVDRPKWFSSQGCIGRGAGRDDADRTSDQRNGRGGVRRPFHRHVRASLGLRDRSLRESLMLNAN